MSSLGAMRARRGKECCGCNGKVKKSRFGMMDGVGSSSSSNSSSSSRTDRGEAL